MPYLTKRKKTKRWQKQTISNNVAPTPNSPEGHVSKRKRITLQSAHNWGQFSSDLLTIYFYFIYHLFYRSLPL